MVVKRTFVIVDVAGVGLIYIAGIVRVLIKHFSKAEHIVGIAGLRPLHIVYHGGKIIGRVEMLAYTLPSDTDSAIVDNRSREETGCMIPFFGVIPIFVVL